MARFAGHLDAVPAGAALETLVHLFQAWRRHLSRKPRRRRATKAKA
jgi:hypothetical protein